MVFAWEALRFSRFRARWKFRPPSNGIEDAVFPACISDAGLADEGQAKKLRQIFNTPLGASGEARRIRGAAPKPPRLFSVVGLGAV